MGVEQFEGLVKETAAQIVAAGVEIEFDDVCQILRVKAWRACQHFDEARAAQGKRMSRPRDRHGRSPLERYVFMCVANMRKDIEKRPRRYEQSIEALRDADLTFEGRYLSIEDEQMFAELHEEPRFSQLSEIERRVVVLRLEGMHLFEIDRRLGLSRVQRERVLLSVREKLGHLLPEAEPRSAPMHPLPAAAPHTARAREPLAA